MDTFLPVALLLVMALGVCAVILVLTHLLGPRNPYGAKLTPYECGVQPEGDSRVPFKNRFYLIAVLFLLIDVEAAFFFPWALVYRHSLSSGSELFWGILIYIALMGLGLIYILRKRVLELTD